MYSSFSPKLTFKSWILEEKLSITLKSVLLSIIALFFKFFKVRKQNMFGPEFIFLDNGIVRFLFAFLIFFFFFYEICLP